MAFPQKLLGEGEHVVLDLRTHPKVLALPVVVVILAAGLGGAAWAVIPPGESWTTAARWVVVGLASLAIVVWSVRPFLQWLTSSYTLTTERLITRRGLINRTGRDIPLGRVNDVAFQQGPFDRLYGCGSLVVSAASDQGSETLTDVPHVSDVQRRMSELVREVHGWVPEARYRTEPATGAAPAAAGGTSPPSTQTGVAPGWAPPDRSEAEPPPAEGS
jgi:membrane protein YdbS with pleckstrin-like domain